MIRALVEVLVLVGTLMVLVLLMALLVGCSTKLPTEPSRTCTDYTRDSGRVSECADDAH